MTQRFRLAVVALIALASLAAAGAAEAQKRRLPSRTEPIPDTESGRPAASASNPSFKGRLTIFGPPPDMPVTPPPAHVRKAEEPAITVAPAATAPSSPAPAAATAPVIAAPAPTPAPPAPVTAPAARVEQPAAVPIPAPAPPPAPAASPAPPPAAVAAPAARPVPPPAPVAATPPPAAPTVAAPAPTIVAPATKPAPPPVVVAPPAPAPATAPKPAPAPQVALAAPSPAAAAAAAPPPIETRLIEGIFHCLSPGLPQDWKKAWIEITDPGAGKEKSSRFFFTNQYGDDQGEPLQPCSAQAITRSIVSLDEKLPPGQRGWTRARLVIDSEGDYELTYDYPK